MSEESLPSEISEPHIQALTLLIPGFPNDIKIVKFKPCVVFNEALQMTEMLLEDTTIVWHPWRGTAGMGHAVDLGYDAGGKLVGIKIWDDVRFRPAQ